MSRHCLAFLALAALLPFTAIAQQMPLNDTGMTLCYDGTELSACTEANSGDAAEYPGQDGRFGRDAAAAAGVLAKTGAGAAGFDFSKLDGNGKPLPATAPDWSCVRDNHTGRVWEVKTDDRGLRDRNWAYTWNENASGEEGDPTTCRNTLGGENCNTHTYAAAVNDAGLCGHTDWRLPTRRELFSIVDLGEVDNPPAIDTDFFPLTGNSGYWSVDELPGAAWIVAFGNPHGIAGSTDIHLHSRAVRVRLVRGGPTPAASATTCPSQTAYTVHADGTVTDTVTGLIWDRCSWGQSGADCSGAPSTHTWPQALKAAVTANAQRYKGHDDWRLPNRSELESLVDLTCQPKINTDVFPQTSVDTSILSNFFWSSTSYPPVPVNRLIVWGVDFGSGGVGFGHRQIDYRVRLVRGGNAFDALTLDRRCGTANGGLFTEPPSSGLCAAGTASAVSQPTGAFTWTCRGENSGLTAQCRATRGHTVTPSAGPHGSIAPNSARIIAYGQTAVFTVTAEPGYRARVGGTCGGTLAGDTYTTDPVTADCTVAARFESTAPAPVPALPIGAGLLLAGLLLGASLVLRRRVVS